MIKISVSRIAEILLLLLTFLTLFSGIFAEHYSHFDTLITIVGGGYILIGWVIVLAALFYNLFFHKSS